MGYYVLSTLKRFKQTFLYVIVSSITNSKRFEAPVAAHGLEPVASLEENVLGDQNAPSYRRKMFDMKFGTCYRVTEGMIRRVIAIPAPHLHYRNN